LEDLRAVGLVDQTNQHQRCKPPSMAPVAGDGRRSQRILYRYVLSRLQVEFGNRHTDRDRLAIDDPTSAIAVDSNGNVYVGDDINIVWKYTAQTQVWSIIAGTEGTTEIQVTVDRRRPLKSATFGPRDGLVGKPLHQRQRIQCDSQGRPHDRNYHHGRRNDRIRLLWRRRTSNCGSNRFVYNMTTDPAGILYFADATTMWCVR